MNFEMFVRDHRRGLINDEMTRAMAEVVEAVRATNAKGKLVLEITVEPWAKGNRQGDVVVLSHKVTAKAPVLAADRAPYFISDAGDLTLTDPQLQMKYPRPAPAPQAAPTVHVDPKTGEVQVIDTTAAATQG